MKDPKAEDRKPELNAALRRLSASMRHSAAGPAVETRLLAAFRQQHGQTILARRAQSWARWGWAAAIAAATAMLFIIPVWRKPDVPALPVPGVPAIAAAPPLNAQPLHANTRPLETRPMIASAKLRTVPRRRRPAETVPPVLGRNPDSDEGDFIPLPEAAHLTPVESIDVVRVKLPRSALMRFGLPVTPEQAWEPVKADVVFGQDGMARAIRLVR